MANQNMTLQASSTPENPSRDSEDEAYNRVLDANTLDEEEPHRAIACARILTGQPRARMVRSQPASTTTNHCS